MTSPCPGPEEIAAFVDGAIDDAGRHRLAAHLVDCETCYRTFSGTVRFLESRRSERSPRRTGVKGVALATAIVGILGIAGSLLWVAKSSHPAERSLARVYATFEGSRPLEARLTDGEYAPPPPRLRGVEPHESTPIAWHRYAIASEIFDHAEADPSPRAVAALGRAHLALGEHDGAIRLLQSITRDGWSDSGLLNDLAAAYIARSTAAGSGAHSAAEDLRTAVAHLDRALELDPWHLPARFNRALSLELLGEEEAGAAWRAYLEADASSDWADEARGRLRFATSP